MKVKELIEELEKLDGKLDVLTFETGDVNVVEVKNFNDGGKCVVLSEYGVDL